MSFYSSRKNPGPGSIEGNALDGLQTRVAISVKRVLDSCRKQLSLEHTKLELKNIPHEAARPFAFTSAASVQTKADISNLRVTRLDGGISFSRIMCDIAVPLKVIFKDKDGKEHTADSQITVSEDVVMYVPDASVFPYEITAAASCTAPTGKFTDETHVECTACLTIITKVVADTDLLMPTYGYCPSPEAVDFEGKECSKFFDLPLYPSGRKTEKK